MKDPSRILLYPAGAIFVVALWLRNAAVREMRGAYTYSPPYGDVPEAITGTLRAIANAGLDLALVLAVLGIAMIPATSVWRAFTGRMRRDSK